MRRFSAIELLIALVVLFVSFPFIEPLRAGAIIKSVLLTLVLISALLAIVERGKTVVVASTLAISAVVARWINDYRPDLIATEVFLIAAILFMFLVIGNLLRYVLAAPSITTNVLCAGISAFFLLSLLWTLGYWLIAEVTPAAFSFNVASDAGATMKGFNAVYFSLITLCTVGYGDITPVSRVARMLAAMEGLTGLLYVAVLIARLVAMHSSPKPNNE